MKLLDITPQQNWILSVVTDTGIIGEFDVSPYLEFEAFEELKKISEFMKVANGGYFVEWECGTDLSADTIEAHLQIKEKAA